EVAQHEADVRVGNQMAPFIDHISLPTLPNLDLRDHVPDECEVDLSDGDAGVTSDAAYRERHVGLGILTKVNRAVVHSARSGNDKCRLFGTVGLAVEHIHSKT